MKTERSNSFKSNFGAQIKLQIVAVFGHFRWLFHLLILGITFFELISSITINNDTHNLPLLYRVSFSMLLIYSFLLLVIPLARALKNKWVLWIGFVINFFFWGFVCIWFVAFIYKNQNFQFNNAAIFGALTVSMLMFMSYYYFVDLFIQQKNFNLFRKKLEQKIEAENKFLKTQINPHFLFNTLNNIYSQSLVQPADAAPTIEELKHLLQYMLYDCDQDFVLLEQEIAFIKSYIQLETLRNKDTKVNTEFQIIGDVKNQKIAPLILVNFVENAFKHGIKSNVEDAFVRVKMYVYGNSFTFSIENSKPENVQSTSVLKNDSGIGIENVKKRLALIYPKRHDLSFKSNADHYAAFLKIRLY